MSTTTEHTIDLEPWEVAAMGRCSQLRRVIDPQPPCDCHYAMNGNGDKALCMANGDANVPELPWFVPPKADSADPFLCCPWGVPGDRLVCRERFYIDDCRYQGELPSIKPTNIETIYYRADGTCCEQIPECACIEYEGKTPWREADTMPRWAVRFTAIITDVRVQRVKEMLIEDVTACGFPPDNSPPHDGTRLTQAGRFMAYAEQFDTDHGPGVWDANPWQWVLEFERE